MELFSYNAADIGPDCKEIARLGENVVYVSESGLSYLLKESGVSYQLNLAESSDPQGFLAEVEKYNL